MYLFFGIFLLLCILFLLLIHWRRCKIIRKICEMDMCRKICLLNELVEPFGYSYLQSQDVMTSRVDAWQREFGYCSLYDNAAVHFNMVFDCEPIYFDHEDRTWLIELWKGQYGINTGGEIGIYQADGLISPDKYASALFHGVPDSQMLPVSMDLYCRDRHLFSVRQIHWWLTGFRMGLYSEPEDLSMRASLTFPDQDMLLHFVQGLQNAGYRHCDLCICGQTVTIHFLEPCTPQPRRFQNLSACFSQWKNRIFCKIYCRLTRPFTCTPDRILYLYYFLPFAFRRILRLKKYKKRHFRRNKR